MSRFTFTPLSPAASFAPVRFPETASQTAGPYVHIGLAPKQAGFDIFENNFGPVLVSPETCGQRIAIEGRVFDGSGALVRDVLVELWQANAHGKYAHRGDPRDLPLDPSFRGWGRACANFETGVFRFETIKPGCAAGAGGAPQAPHVCLVLFARGINLGLHTRLYFDDEADANRHDPVLNSIEWATRRETLIAQQSERDGVPVYALDIRLQDTPDGGRETVFFDI